MAEEKPPQTPASGQQQQQQSTQQPSQFPRPAMQEIGKSADPPEHKDG